ncbi:MAG: dienelactone hydrolase family protein [Bryobacterales bacterium]
MAAKLAPGFNMTIRALLPVFLCLPTFLYLPAFLCLIVAPLAAQEPLRNTAALTWEGDLSMRLMEGAHRFVERKIGESTHARQKHWSRDLTSPEAYARSIEPNRRRFREAIGLPANRPSADSKSSSDQAGDAVAAPRFEYYGDDESPALVAETPTYRIHQVRWPVLEGVFGEGLLLRPIENPKGAIIALPDADQTPEQAVGLASGVPAEAQFARRLAENGFEVLVPVLIDRESHWSGTEALGYTQQSHREWIYRQAYQMGRHIIGYEVEKISAAVDVFVEENRARANASGATENANRIGVAGYAEGALLAFYAAAADPRIDAALVSAYYSTRTRVWAEPIYRNVWGLLKEFGDAEIATLIAPRALIVEYAEAPRVTGQKGDWGTPGYYGAKAEFDRIDSLINAQQMTLNLGVSPDPARGAAGTDLAATQTRTAVTFPRHFTRSPSGPGSDSALEPFSAAMLDTAWTPPPPRPTPAPVLKPLEDRPPQDRREAFSPAGRQKRQLKQLETHVQRLVRQSEHARNEFFLEKALPASTEARWTTRLDHGTLPAAPFVEAAEKYRQYFRDEILGQFDQALLPPNARTRKIYDREKWTGYEVVLDVWPEVIAWGVILIPKNIAPGERRPVVVCQHGRRGVPSEVIEGDNPAYHDFAARLADEGFVTFAPHNLYRGEDRYRWLDRKANSIKASMFSFILAQHEQILNWLGTLPFVDPARIAFYGLSYGGETAVRVPTLLEGYALSICSGDFNNWTRKIAATDQPFSFMYTIEWEMPYFNMGSTFDYAELAYLMAPRPFMVERGHHDRVGRDQWVAHEYAKVRWLYTQLGLGDKTEIEYFNGGHTIHGQGTFQFLRKHLNWPGPGASVQ